MDAWDVFRTTEYLQDGRVTGGLVSDFRTHFGHLGRFPDACRTARVAGGTSGDGFRTSGRILDTWDVFRTSGRLLDA